MSNEKSNLKNGMLELYKIALSMNQNGEFYIFGRVKSKLSRVINLIRGKNLDDVLAATIVFSNTEECFNFLNRLKASKIFTIEEDEKNFIDNPKPNGYMAIHVKTKIDNITFEIQIKTKRMLKDAEFGDASHGKYKKVYKGKNNKLWRKLLKKRPEKVLMIIEQEIKGEKHKDIVELLGEYARTIGIDLNDMLNVLKKENPIIENLKTVNEKMKVLLKNRQYTKKEISRLNKYIAINEQIIADYEMGLRNGDITALTIIKKQSMYFIVHELIKSGKNITKIREEIEKYGKWATQAFSEICIMMGMEHFELNNANISRLVYESLKEKTYAIRLKDGRIKVKRTPKECIIKEILGGERE